ncbi:TRP75-related protein [Anaplasma phagocytophilum]|uniref:TRP75-related protein n=1 Tax=Anaplasma phagocytophilum TaxID=948 RepID=UPI00201AF853
MLRFVLSVVVLLILSSCGGKYAFEMSRNYAPPYNPGGDYFDDDENFAQSYEIYEKRREDALREQESIKKRSRGRDLQQESGRRQISDEEKGKIIDKLQRYGVMYSAGERRKGGMVNSEGIDLSRVRGARFIDVDLSKSGVISGKEEKRYKEDEFPNIPNIEEQSSVLDAVSGELPKDGVAENQEGIEVKVDCDCEDDCDCPTGAHKSHGEHKRLSHPVEVEEGQSPALDVISSELPKDGVAENQEGIEVKVDCDCEDDCDCPTGAHKSHGEHKRLSHPVEVEEGQSPALDVISSELPKDGVAENQEGIEVKVDCNAGDDCPSDDLNLERGNDEEVAVYGEGGASSKYEENVAKYGSFDDVGTDKGDVVEDNDIYPWWEEYDVVEGFGAFDDSRSEDYESESSPVFRKEERAEEDFDVYQDSVEVGDDEGVPDSSEDLAADSDVDSVTGGEEGDYMPDDGDEGASDIVGAYGDATTSPSAGKGVADDLSSEDDDSTFFDEGKEGGYKGIDKGGDGYRIPMSLPDSRSIYYDLGDFMSLR